MDIEFFPSCFGSKGCVFVKLQSKQSFCPVFGVSGLKMDLLLDLKGTRGSGDTNKLP